MAHRRSIARWAGAGFAGRLCRQLGGLAVSRETGGLAVSRVPPGPPPVRFPAASATKARRPACAPPPVLHSLGAGQHRLRPVHDSGQLQQIGPAGQVNDPPGRGPQHSPNRQSALLHHRPASASWEQIIGDPARGTTFSRSRAVVCAAHALTSDIRLDGWCQLARRPSIEGTDRLPRSRSPRQCSLMPREWLRRATPD